MRISREREGRLGFIKFCVASGERARGEPVSTPSGDNIMSLKIETKDWRFEITWDGMLCTPLEKEEQQQQKKTGASGRRRPRPGGEPRPAAEPLLRKRGVGREFSNEVR
ncbi:MAG: hypothetical protein ACKVX9_19975 [Blastocatellia bacterium]